MVIFDITSLFNFFLFLETYNQVILGESSEIETKMRDDAMRSLNFFHDVQVYENVMKQFVFRTKQIIFEPGSTIIQEGVENDKMYFISIIIEYYQKFNTFFSIWNSFNQKESRN